MPRHIDQSLTQLKEMLLIMGSRAEIAVSQALRAAVERNDEMATNVVDQDRILDQYEMDLDETAINLLLSGPVASDLRLITMAMKISHDLERIGDEATTIARRSRELNQAPPLKEYHDIPRMGVLVLDMLNHTLSAFVHGDVELARSIILKDREVDALNKKERVELIGYMKASSANIDRCLNLMIIVKCLERIADHAVAIAEEVIYLCQAMDVRHSVKHTEPPTLETSDQARVL